MLQDPKSSKLVLIVDDECPIRTILAQALRLAGYKIRVVETGAETLELFARNHEQIGLIIYDWNRPDISGERVIAEIVRINSNVPIVVSTDSGSSAHLSKLYPTIVAQLLKPYDLNNVLRELGEYLPDHDQHSNIADGERPRKIERYSDPNLSGSRTFERLYDSQSISVRDRRRTIPV